MSNERQQRAARAEQMRKEREKADRKQRNVITIAIVVVVAVLIGVGGWAINKADNDREITDKLNTPVNTTDDYGIVYDTAAAGGTVPDGTTPVEVELYEDFQCPACEAFEGISGSFLKEKVKAGEITITYRPYSFLDNGGSPNRYSHRSTNLALCALDAGGVADYVKVHDYLYANQPEERTDGPENSELITAAKGLGITGIDACVKTEKFNRWVDDAKEAGDERGVDSTPSVFIAGKASEARTPDELQKAIDAAKG